jgi:hypothetical protein
MNDDIISRANFYSGVPEEDERAIKTHIMLSVFTMHAVRIGAAYSFKLGGIFRPRRLPKHYLE